MAVNGKIASVAGVGVGTTIFVPPVSSSTNLHNKNDNNNDNIRNNRREMMNEKEKKTASCHSSTCWSAYDKRHLQRWRDHSTDILYGGDDDSSSYRNANITTNKTHTR